MASSLARPPALRITCASPSARPAYLAGSSRASMQVRIAKRRAGGRANVPLSPKLALYFWFASSTSDRIWLMRISFWRMRTPVLFNAQDSTWPSLLKADARRLARLERPTDRECCAHACRVSADTGYPLDQLRRRRGTSAE